MAAQAYGGFWIRFLAYLVDSVILFTALLVLGAGAAFAGGSGMTVLGVLCIVGPLLYWALMQASARQATFGKALLGLKVTDSDGERLSIVRSLAREVAKIVSAIPLLLGFLLAAFTGRKQALHDMIAGTTVVRDSPGHLVVGLVVGFAGWLAPVALVMVLGIGMFAAMMGGVAGGLMQQAMKDAVKQGQPVTISASAARASAPRVQLPSAGDLDKALATRLVGLDSAGTTRAGPAVLELDKNMLFGSDFSMKVYLPPLKEFEGDSATVLINRVVNTKGADVYDATSSFEKDAFFQRVSLSPGDKPLAHLGGKRRVHLKSGSDAKEFDRADGVLKLNLAVNPLPAAFAMADVGKSKTVHGVEVVFKAAKGAQVSFDFKGEHDRVASVTAYTSDERPLRPVQWGGGGGSMTYGYSEPPSRVEVLVVQSFTQREFPFTLSRTSTASAETPVAAAAPAASTPASGAAVLAAPAAAVAPTPVVASAPPAADEKAPPLTASAVQAKSAPRVAAASTRTAEPRPIEPRRISQPAVLAAMPAREGPKYNDLMTAVLAADPAAVQELLEFGKWADKPDSNGMTPLAAAALRGDRTSAEALLKAGADPDRALRIARERRDEAMSSLLEKYRK
jgi:uncharacterized RDD family membrane protein YckC